MADDDDVDYREKPRVRGVDLEENGVFVVYDSKESTAWVKSTVTVDLDNYEWKRKQHSDGQGKDD